MFENEQWRIIKSLPHYQISSCGRVKRVGQVEARKVAVSDKGYPIVTLYGADSKTRNLRQINVLVAEAFLPPPFEENEKFVWHIDGDLLNCRADNLKWASKVNVMEWNEMHRAGKPAFNTPRVRNNRTGVTYESAYECAMAEGRLETDIIWRIEQQARHMEDNEARYRYLIDGREV